MLVKKKKSIVQFFFLQYRGYKLQNKYFLTLYWFTIYIINTNLSLVSIFFRDVVTRNP